MRLPREKLANVMDRYIYDYDLFKECSEDPHCSPTDYEKCESIDFFDISDSSSISKIKSSFLSATQMPNIVQYDRLNSHEEKKKYVGTLSDRDFLDVYNKLVSIGFLDRDNLIDFDYLKRRTSERFIFPDVIYEGNILHPITFIYPKNHSPKVMLTRDFIKDPLGFLREVEKGGERWADDIPDF